MGDTPTKDVRQINDAAATGMVSTGLELMLLAVLFGGSALLLQWAVLFIAVGVVVHGAVKRGADVADWAWSKVPENPFKSKEGQTHD